MPKSRDAFALRDFDTERILQQNFFLHSLGVAYKETDAATLDLNDARNVAHRGSAEMAVRISELQRIKARVAAYKNLLEEHTSRLESLCTKYARKFTETAVQTWKEKYRRAQNLQQAYSDAKAKLCILQEKILELEGAGEKAIDQQRRKEFSARLQDARKKTRMKQSDLALKVKVAPTTIANYEQGRADPQIPLLIRIAQALKVSADWLLGLK